MGTSAETLNAKQVNKGALDIMRMTSQLTQVLRQFETLYAKKLPSCEGLTVEAWMSAMGVERFTVTKKDGKVQKKGYTPGTIRKGWHTAMQTESGKMCIFKNVLAKYKTEDGSVESVYTIEEASKIDGKCVTRYMLTEIADDKWTVNLILRGLRQGRDFKKYNDRSVDTDLAWAGMEDLCIIKKGENGEREIVKIEKSEVYF